MCMREPSHVPIFAAPALAVGAAPTRSTIVKAVTPRLFAIRRWPVAEIGPVPRCTAIARILLAVYIALVVTIALHGCSRYLSMPCAQGRITWVWDSTLRIKLRPATQVGQFSMLSLPIKQRIHVHTCY